MTSALGRSRLPGAVSSLRDSSLLGRMPAMTADTAGLLLFGLSAVLMQTFFWSATAPSYLKLLVGSVAVLSAFRPGAGLLVVAGLTPFGRIIAVDLAQAYPARFTEALVLAFLAGWFANGRRGAAHRARVSPAAMLAILFGAAILASLAVELVVLHHWKDYWWPFAGRVVRYLSRDYLGVNVQAWPTPLGMDGATSIGSAALLLQGLALSLAVRRIALEHPSFLSRLVGVLAVAAVGTAVLSVSAAGELAISDPTASGPVWARLLDSPRLAVHTGKVNTAASSFVLFLPCLVGMVLARSSSLRQAGAAFGERARKIALPALGAVLVLAALWISGSRSGLAAVAVVASLGSLLWVTGSRWRRMNRSSLLVPVAVLVATGVIFGFGLYAKLWSVPEQASLTVAAVRVRQLGLLTSVRMIRDSPAFGVGIGQYYRLSQGYTPEALAYAMERPFNAHNQFLQVAAELGLSGLALFAGLLFVVWVRAWRVFRRSRDHLLGGVLAGLVAFIITSLAGQPLLVEVVAYPFWITLGVALAYGDGPSAASPDGQSRSRVGALIAAVAVAALAISVPFRSETAVAGTNLVSVSYGITGHGMGSDGRIYRLLNGRGTLFAPPDTTGIEVEVRPHQLWLRPVSVDLRVDGRSVARLSLAADRWEPIRVPITPEPSRVYRRIEIEARAPTGARTLARITDPRLDRASR